MVESTNLLPHLEQTSSLGLILNPQNGHPNILAAPLAIGTIPASLAVYSEQKQTLYALLSLELRYRSRLAIGKCYIKPWPSMPPQLQERVRPP
jgi:hypothetical protein